MAEKIKMSDLIGKDDIDSFRGIVVELDNERFVMVDECEVYSADHDTEYEIVRFESPRMFYSPYIDGDEAASTRVIGEIRPIGYTELADNVTLFGYTRPTIINSYALIKGKHYPVQHAYLTYYQCEYYRLHGEIMWDTPILPLTPVDAVRIERYHEPIIVDDEDITKRTDAIAVVGDMIDNRFGEAVELDEAPDFEHICVHLGNV